MGRRSWRVEHRWLGLRWCRREQHSLRVWIQSRIQETARRHLQQCHHETSFSQHSLAQCLVRIMTLEVFAGPPRFLPLRCSMSKMGRRVQCEVWSQQASVTFVLSAIAAASRTAHPLPTVSPQSALFVCPESLYTTNSTVEPRPSVPITMPS